MWWNGFAALTYRPQPKVFSLGAPKTEANCFYFFFFDPKKSTKSTRFQDHCLIAKFNVSWSYRLLSWNRCRCGVWIVFRLIDPRTLLSRENCSLFSVVLHLLECAAPSVCENEHSSSSWTFPASVGWRVRDSTNTVSFLEFFFLILQIKMVKNRYTQMFKSV